MGKLTLAHSYMVEYVKSNGLDVTDLEVRCAFDIAEAMLAENEKRTDKTRPAVLDEFQVDWRVAPSWAKWWAMDKDGEYYFFENNPEMKSVAWMPIDAAEVSRAPSFGYTGNWQDSLRERK